jgi:hypothetical protein
MARLRCSLVLVFVGTFALFLNGRTAVAQPATAPLTAEGLEALWEDLGLPGEAGARIAYEHVRALAGSPSQAVNFLKQRLRPLPASDSEFVRKLIVDLDGRNFAARAEATARLKELGWLAVPALRKELRRSPALEARRRMEQLLALVDARPPTADELRGLRAVEALSLIGTPGAKQHLQTLAAGAADAWLTDAAAAALKEWRR